MVEVASKGGEEVAKSNRADRGDGGPKPRAWACTLLPGSIMGVAAKVEEEEEEGTDVAFCNFLW